MASRKKKKNHSSNTGCLVLFAGLVILLVIFVVKFPDIKATLDSTNFLDIVKKRATTTTVRMQEVLPPPASVPSTSSSVVPVSRETTDSTSRTSSSVPPATTLPATTTSVGTGGTTVATAVQVRQANLFFVRIEDDGVISRREVRRMIPVSDSPLADAINALIAGPSEGEIRSGLVSLVPRGTKLLGITLRGSTAIINLSDAFMYNHYGIEGFSAQLKQIVYTATSFPSVQDVQILVEGKAKDYLGGEGVYIGKPLSRNSF